MSKVVHSAQQYWDDRSDLFGSYYTKPSLFDKIFRKGIYTRIAVSVKTSKDYDNPVVLDVGSGPGVNSVTLLKTSNAQKVVGIDFAPNMLEYAQKYAQEQGVAGKCEFFEGDFMKHDWGHRRFDVSVAMGVLDYIEDAKGFVQRMADVTDKAFVISWPENGLRMTLRRYRYTCPLFHYTESEIRELHSAAGLDTVDVVKSEGGWVTIGRK
jgi:SAM-dependent methyltransferase